MLGSAVPHCDMADANFNKEKKGKLCLYANILKHSSGAELIKLLIMLKTQTRKEKQDFFPQSRYDHRLIASRWNIYPEYFLQAGVDTAGFYPCMSATAE